jgi:hypothetical protein
MIQPIPHDSADRKTTVFVLTVAIASHRPKDVIVEEARAALYEAHKAMSDRIALVDGDSFATAIEVRE